MGWDNNCFLSNKFNHLIHICKQKNLFLLKFLCNTYYERTSNSLRQYSKNIPAWQGEVGEVGGGEEEIVSWKFAI